MYFPCLHFSIKFISIYSTLFKKVSDNNEASSGLQKAYRVRPMRQSSKVTKSKLQYLSEAHFRTYNQTNAIDPAGLE